MKATRSLKTVCLFALASFLFIAAPGCKKDEEAPKPKTLCELIEGDWEVTSYRYDGVELINSDGIKGVDIEFEDADCEGDFGWTFVYTDGGTSYVFGEYSIDEDDEELETAFFSGETATFDLEIDEEDGELEMSGTNDVGTSMALKAERK